MLSHRRLAQQLKAHWRLRGIHYPIFRGEGPEVESLASLAAQMAPALDGVEGPIVLSGYSIGGLVAYEIAALLRASGRKTVVVIMDSTSRQMLFQRRRSLSVPHRILRRYRMAFHRIFVRWPRRFLYKRGWWRPKEGKFMPKEPHLRAFHDAGVTAVRDYFPPTTDVPVVIVRAVPPWQPDWLRRIYWPLRDGGWGLVAPVLDVVATPGNHLGIADPANAEVLAPHLDRAYRIAFAHLDANDRSRSP